MTPWSRKCCRCSTTMTCCCPTLVTPLASRPLPCLPFWVSDWSARGVALDPHILNIFKLQDIWVCLKMGYTPNYSHLVGIMIINHWVFWGTQHFQTNPYSGFKYQSDSHRYSTVECHSSRSSEQCRYFLFCFCISSCQDMNRFWGFGHGMLW